MAISFPRTDIAGMFTIDGVPMMVNCEFTPNWRQENSRTASGRLYTRDLGPEIWTVSAVSAPLEIADAQRIEAAFHSLAGSSRGFLFHDFRRPAPISGDSLAGASPYIHEAGDTTLRLDGLPSGFALNAGDYVAFTYSGTKRALHRVMEGASATISGRTPAFEVRPAVRAGATAGTFVSLVNASCEMVLEPGSLAVASVGPVHATVSFRAVQVIE